MAGYVPSASGPPRVRIKGRTWSVLRFFTIALSFMLLWVLITSQLGYYSRWFGPQILLILSLVFNLPAIPVLIFAGQVEKLLDAKFGPITSMAVRLNTGLIGCTVCAAVFPFVATTYIRIMVLVAILGMASAIAFSTAYQLAQWFRHADIIALGIGGVGTGPLVLLLQLCLGVGPHPERWQWITMFEVTAAVMFLGILSSMSLFAQYWKIMTGEEEYIEPSRRGMHAPLLPAVTDESDDLPCMMEQQTRRLVRAATQRTLLPPDPTAYAVAAVLTPGSFTWPDEDDRGVPCLQRAATWVGHSASHKKGWPELTSPVGAAAATRSRPRRMPRAMSVGHKLGETGAARNNSRHADGSIGAHVQASWRPSDHEAARVRGAAWQPPSLDVVVGSDLPQEDDGTLQVACDTVPGHGSSVVRPEEQALEAALSAVLSQEDTQASDCESSPAYMTLQQENIAVIRDSWQVMLAFLVSVVITYVVFPFFTYVPSNWIGDELPKVLFFARIFADIVGRFAPRRKALMVHSPSVLLSLALFKLVLATLFFLYIKAPARFQHDMVVLVLIIIIWLMGGYINTSANILGPSVVAPQLAGRASALLALLFQVAHFAGLILAVGLAFILYGDIAE